MTGQGKRTEYWGKLLGKEHFEGEKLTFKLMLGN